MVPIASGPGRVKTIIFSSKQSILCFCCCKVYFIERVRGREERQTDIPRHHRKCVIFMETFLAISANVWFPWKHSSPSLQMCGFHGNIPRHLCKCVVSMETFLAISANVWLPSLSRPCSSNPASLAWWEGLPLESGNPEFDSCFCFVGHFPGRVILVT